MNKPEYISLHSHFHQSLLDGFSNVKEYLDRAEEIKMPGLGTSDHGNVFNSYEFVKAARERGLIAIPGCEMYVAPINPEGARVKRPVFYGPNGQKAKFDVSSNGAYLHMTVWAVNNEGIKNLFRLSSKSFQVENNYSKNRIDFEMLAEHHEGLVVATGCPSSEISTRFLLDQDEKAYEYAGRLKEVFGKERLFVEVMNHDMSIDLERILLPKQRKLAKDLGLRLLATNDTHYAHQSDAKHHEEMLCIQSGARMSDKTYDQGGGRFAFEGDQYYLKTAEEMLELFPADEFPNALKSSLEIAEMASDLSLDFDPHLKPNPPIPAEFKSDTHYFKHLINEGFKKRYGNASPEIKKEAKERIQHEYTVIHSSDFIGYFLTVYEYLNWAKENYSTRDEQNAILASSLGPGRGSVGGSIIAYILEISELDPIRFDLVFERFLSAGRGATYRITYDDGSTEEVLVSEEKILVSGDKEKKVYIHQLNEGDTLSFS